MLPVRRLPGILYQRRYAILLFAVIIFIIMYYMLHWGIMCTNIETWQHVNKLCRLHQKGDAVGSLCKPLCEDKQIETLTCHAFHAGKEAVFSANWEENRMVFKASRRAKNELVDAVYWLDSQGKRRYPSEDDFSGMIRDVVSTKLNLSISNGQLQRLSRLGYTKSKEGSALRQIEMQNLWILLQDNEYLCSVLYSDRDVFPQLLGTCGGFFAVEYVEPVQPASSVLSVSDGKEAWASRIRLAVLILDLLEELETNMPEPFHLCDIKITHFGMAKGGQRLKFLDLDSVLPRTIANRATGDGSHCTKHEDCDFFDCRSRCNEATSRCDLPVTNNNFQVVCEKLFLGWTLSGTVILPGLLMSQHTPSSLASLLRQCANPDSDAGSSRAATPDDIRHRLYTTITEMDQMLSSEFN
ncbi:divergent protein kinase domain 1C [Anabrus simplex]|uniref:divergent protein kinase domain 1C n=1 Tax=Anabrus simplex TaxID=316456 RepID=UPI0035A334CE